MRIFVSIFISIAVLLSGGCAIFEKETTNRGGYLDYILDEHWLKADSKGMRALRAFAIQVSLARIASVSAKNESDRQLLAIRIGALTKRFLPIYACAFDTNPLGVPGGENDPCFYYDSAMVDYSTGLFDLAMVALPIDDAKKLVTAVTGSVVNPANLLDLLDTLLQIGKDALKYGRVVGALYRDTVELEVQLWLATPAIDNRPPPFQVTEADVAALREIYSRRNDDMPAWLTAIAALRGQGLEPLAQRRFFVELGGLMNYICNLISKDPNALPACKAGLPTTIPAPASVLGPTASIGLGNAVPVTKGGSAPQGNAPKPTRASAPAPAPTSPAPGPTAGPTPTPAPTPTPPNRLSNFELSLTAKDIEDFQKAVCVSVTGDLGPLDSPTRIAIKNALQASNQLLTDREAIKLREKLNSGATCPAQ
jgi:hypothetical protein